MYKNYRPYTQKKREKNNKTFIKKERYIIPTLNLFISLLTLFVSGYVGINTYRLDNSNSYPAFEFEISEGDEAISTYTINKTKGEMNNVNFSVFEVVSGTGIYNDNPISINQSVKFTHDDSLNDLQASYPYTFNSEKVKNRLNVLLGEKKINVNIKSLFIQRYYKISYMNFEHEPKEEYYEIGKEGTGRFVTTSFRNYGKEKKKKVLGSLLGIHDDKGINNAWLANKLLLQIESTF